MSTEDTERELRALFAADAESAPSAAGLADGARRRVRARRVRAAAGAGLLVAAGVVGAVVLGDAPGDAEPGPPAAQTPGTHPAAGGALPVGPDGDCGPYLPMDLVTWDLAVDGTVVAIGPQPSWGPEEPEPRVEVTLAVHEWFVGGAGETATVEMYPPTAALSEPPPAYGVGSRLLVAAVEDRDGGLVASSCGFTRHYDRVTAAEWTAAASAGPADGPTGELPTDSAASCVEEYSPQAVADRAFAFDGTVVAIGPPVGNGGGAPLDLVGVTFRVDEWYRGGSGETVTVDMDPPDGGLRTSEPVAVYGIGTRLLVSGEPRWGGAPLDAPLAWSCGFTRYSDPATAAGWAAATG
ncbi:hypothetical protein [Blastococcus sp. TF02A-26]|uniref:hypothetical protein n=1 Tax=Blastococcus sp. TF02A-26 TaxID=2250577 RepID=UPI000DE9D470|nr:hypothetical protein [Blastococcus sp. TF02A-26]RBY90793.1 hypothetical protein DQ240_01705 [Blastococcus sp. TF02A-26]